MRSMRLSIAILFAETQVSATNSYVPCSSLDPAECGFPRGQMAFSAEGASNAFDSSEVAFPSGVPDADVSSCSDDSDNEDPVFVDARGWTRWAAV